jgi:MazG family protein
LIVLMDNKNEKAFSRLVDIMNDLREKCPWDKKQTIQSLRQMTIEETYELADAITENDWKGIKEELGDLLLHIVFYSKIAKEENQFEIHEMIDGVCDKLIARHPHIYGDVKVNDDEDVKRNWEKLKLKEGKTSVLGGVPQSLPATVKAMRLQEKAKQVGFEWDDKEQVWEKVEEEMKELKEAVNSWQLAIDSKNQRGDNEKSNSGNNIDTLKRDIEYEFGDVVFSLINYARFLQVDAENALELTNKKFISRFTEMEKLALQSGKNLNEMTLQEMDAIWNTIKQYRTDK